MHQKSTSAERLRLPRWRPHSMARMETAGSVVQQCGDLIILLWSHQAAR